MLTLRLENIILDIATASSYHINFIIFCDLESMFYITLLSSWVLCLINVLFSVCSELYATYLKIGQDPSHITQHINICDWISNSDKNITHHGKCFQDRHSLIWRKLKYICKREHSLSAFIREALKNWWFPIICYTTSRNRSYTIFGTIYSSFYHYSETK